MLWFCHCSDVGKLKLYWITLQRHPLYLYWCLGAGPQHLHCWSTGDTKSLQQAIKTLVQRHSFTCDCTKSTDHGKKYAWSAHMSFANIQIHYSDVIMSVMAYQIIGVSIYSPFDSGGDQRKTSKLRTTGPWEGNSLVTGERPAQKANNAENVFIWWRHHVYFRSYSSFYKCQKTTSMKTNGKIKNLHGFSQWFGSKRQQSIIRLRLLRAIGRQSD